MARSYQKIALVEAVQNITSHKSIELLILYLVCKKNPEKINKIIDYSMAGKSREIFGIFESENTSKFYNLRANLMDFRGEKVLFCLYHKSTF